MLDLGLEPFNGSPNYYSDSITSTANVIGIIFTKVSSTETEY